MLKDCPHLVADSDYGVGGTKCRSRRLRYPQGEYADQSRYRRRIEPDQYYRISDRFSIGAGVSIIYTIFEHSVMINQVALVGPGAPDGKVRIDNATEWGCQPFLRFTLRLTDRALLDVM